MSPVSANSVVYLDHNATTPVRPEASRAVAEALAMIGNPSSVHRFGRMARRVMEDAREQVAALMQVSPRQVIFTSGGTEANHLALTGCKADRVMVSAVEHPSVLNARPDVEVLGVGNDGVVDLNALESKLTEARINGQTALVSVMAANNETGILQPWAQISDIATRCNAVFHCDAVQAVPRMTLSLESLGAHMVSISAHKLGGPTGVGALIVSDGYPISDRVQGSGQERGRRSGTENLSGIAGFGAAAAVAISARDDLDRQGKLRDQLEAGVRELTPEARIVGANLRRLANTSCIAMKGHSAESQVMAFDLAGIAVSAGSACSSGKVGASHVLAAMGAGDDAASAIRVSLGWTSTKQDVDRFLEVWKGLHGGQAKDRDIRPETPAAQLNA